ncbi:tetratricopeptide repeat protein [Plantactinospora sp. B5E13]|uniref:tetratricopeptide repeat protein n=1 Tax=Plantactinospora sp. B5E13 TaxID=3153758 RepID=UPI00325F9437
MSDTEVTVQQRALALAQVGRYVEAADLLRGLLAERPEHVGVMLQLARCHRELGQLAEAMRLVDRALGVATAQEHLLAEKARILFAAGHPEHAASAAHRALEQNPRSWSAHGLLAEALLALGNPTRVVLARRHADTALELAPQVPEVHLLDARLHARMGRLRAARAACGQALALEPGYEPALRQLALLDAGQDRAGRAARQFTAALTVDPQRADAAAPTYQAIVAALCWRLFDMLALVGLGHLLLFALLGDALGDARRPARLAVAVAVPLAVAGWAALTWRRQPAPLRGQLRRQARSSPVLTCLLLSLAVAAGLVLGSLVPVLGWLLLVPGYLVFAFRGWRQLQRRAAPAVRWLGYRIWSRLAARTSLSVGNRSD